MFKKLASLILSGNIILSPALAFALPSLTYSTYLGGTVEDRVNAIALDNDGNVYLTGLAVSGLFPGTAGHFQSAISGGTDAFVTKINAAGNIVWSTYLGGGGIDIGNSIAVDGLGRVHITGSTTSTDFPTASPYQATNGGGTDAFVATIAANGNSLVYSTYLGGAGVENGNGIAVDTSGTAYITGDTTSDATTFPQTVGSYQTVAGGARDAFVAKFSAAGGINYSTFLGGTADDMGHSIAIDGVGNAYVTGQAADTFPIFPLAVPTAFKTTITGPFDCFISKLDSTGASLLYSTYVGGSDIDDAFGIALDGFNPATLKVYITGYTFSADMPNPGTGFANVGQTTIGTAPDAYLFKLDPNGGGAIMDGVFFTYLGGSNDDRAQAVKVDGGGNSYLTGHTQSGDFPMINPINGTLVGTGMVFVTEVGPTGGVNVFSTYLGGVTDQQGNGVGLDETNNIYVGGWTSSTDYPTALPIQPANAGDLDGFLTKISAPSPFVPPIPPIPPVPPIPPIPPIIPPIEPIFNDPTGVCNPPYIYPSPTRGNKATVSYCMGTYGMASIRIYNESGELVETVDENKQIGPQETKINLSKLQTGVYFYFLTLKYNGGYIKRYPKKKFAVTQ